MKKWFLLISICMLFGCDEITSKDTPTDQIPVEVVEVIDGDTIKIRYNGNIKKVRYLLIDTPEINHQTLGKQPFGEEAKARNLELLNSGDISIEFDVGDRIDKYGRMLAYIYVDGVSVQNTLLEEGYARVAYVYPPNTKYLDEFEKAVEIAKKENLGVWETENYVTNRGFDASVFQEIKSNTPNENCNIKGNINRKGNKIFHIPGDKDYEQTKPEVWFCSEQEAKDEGFKKAS